MAKPWRFAFSPTLKSIYVLRYLLFSGGAAIAVALIQRQVTPTERPTVGLLTGLLLGLVAFRGQLRPFTLPVLALGREGLLLVRKRKATVVPWQKVRAVTPSAQAATLALTEPLPGLDGAPSSELPLVARDFGLTAQELSDLIQPLLDPVRHAALPTEAQIREHLRIEPD